MKKGTLLVLVYAGVVTALVVSVKVAKTYVTRNSTPHAALIADCGDPPPPTPGGE